MIDQRRWMVRPRQTDRVKLPQSPHIERPEAYKPEPDESPNRWRYAWTQPAIWGTWDEAFLYWQQHSQTIAGLSYVVHPIDDTQKDQRVVCLDFDNAIDPQTGIDKEVEQLLNNLDTWVEVSVNGRGLHAFVLSKCEPFVNVLKQEIGDATVDILCSSQIAVTGEVFGHWGKMRELPAERLYSLAAGKVRRVSSECPDWWSEPQTGIAPNKTHLVEVMQTWAPCIEGEGGDKTYFEAACHLARNGVTGWHADELLQLVPQFPPFTEKERRHKIECAYQATQGDGTYDGAGAFELIEDKTPEGRYGFKPIAMAELELLDLDIEFLVEGAFVDGEPCFIGGREKCFKTGIAADLSISLAAGVPFLNQFHVRDTRRVAFFTAEIGFPSAKKLFERIRDAKGLQPQSIQGLDVIDTVPSFALDKSGKAVNVAGIKGLQRYFEEREPQVAVFDPLYLAMGGAQVGDMYEIGGVLRHISSVCKLYDVWPIFCHHAKKDNSKQFEPMELADFYGSGISAFARQWFLVSHAEPYAQGRANLYARMGGSAAGDCGLWRVAIDEGQPDTIIERKWEVSVQDESEAVAADVQTAVLNALVYHAGSPQGIKAIALWTESPEKLVKSTLMDMVREGTVDMLDGGKFICR